MFTMSTGNYETNDFSYSNFKIFERDRDTVVRRSKMAFARPSSVFMVISEVTLWLMLSVLTFLLAYNLIGVEPFRRGFFCDDETIKYPYKEDTVSDTMVAVLFIVVPIIFMVITETVHIMTSKERKATGIFFHTFAVRFYRTVGAFLFATLCTMFLTETTKLFGGRLRPHFMSLCKPNLSKLNCTAGYVIIRDVTCTSDVSVQKLLDARKSFPSGHASLATFGAIYLLVYLQFRFIWTNKIRILLPLVQIGIVCSSVYVCISRVNDNKHHVGDVIGGAVLGTVVALLSIKYVSCNRKTKDQTSYFVSGRKGDITSLPVHLNLPVIQNGHNTNTVVEMGDI